MPADDQLDQPPFSLLAVLTARYPDWTIWFGEATRHWWALPPQGREPHDFIEAPTVKELVESIEAIKVSPRVPSVAAGGTARGAGGSRNRRLPAASWQGGATR